MRMEGQDKEGTPMITTWYHVWRRTPDSYVNATATTQGSGAQVERELNARAGSLNGERCTFTVLLSTQDWDAARAAIASARGQEA